MRDAFDHNVAFGRERFADLDIDRRRPIAVGERRANYPDSITDAYGASVLRVAGDFDSTCRSCADKPEKRVPGDRRAVRDRDERLENPHVDVLLRIRLDVREEGIRLPHEPV
jgi:hypothetical protein